MRTFLSQILLLPRLLIAQQLEDQENERGARRRADGSELRRSP